MTHCNTRNEPIMRCHPQHNGEGYKKKGSPDNETMCPSMGHKSAQSNKVKLGTLHCKVQTSEDKSLATLAAESDPKP